MFDSVASERSKTNHKTIKISTRRYSKCKAILTAWRIQEHMRTHLITRHNWTELKWLISVIQASSISMNSNTNNSNNNNNDRRENTEPMWSVLLLLLWLLLSRCFYCHTFEALKRCVFLEHSREEKKRILLVVVCRRRCWRFFSLSGCLSHHQMIPNTKHRFLWFSAILTHSIFLV